MRKFFSIILSVLLTLSCALGFVGCAKDGENGLSAFEIYKKYHPEYTGTEEEWLESLKGSDGTDAKDGVSVESAYIDEKGYLIILLSDGTEINCGKVTYSFGESLSYRPVVESGKIVGYEVAYIGNFSGADVIIPPEYAGLPVTGIAEYAFFECDNITAVSIPNTVKSIGASAFARCENLKSVNVSSIESWCGISFENMGANPMYFASELRLNGIPVTNLVIPDSVTSIPDFAFYGCQSLTSVTVGSGVREIGESAFYGCENLDTLTLNGAIADMGSLAFGGCPLLWRVQIGNEVETIGEYAFYECTYLIDVTIPASVKSIGESAFSMCSRLEKVNFNEGLEYIGDCAFAGCSSLEEFIMPDSVTEIGFGILMFTGSFAFDGGTPADGTNKLKKLVLSDNLTAIPQFAFSQCRISTIAIGKSVEMIDYSAFYGCDLLEYAVISRSVRQIASYAFYRCDKLNTVYYEGTAEEWEEVDVSKNGNDIVNAQKYFYSAEEPTEDGNFWHYAEDGKTPEKW